ncbi:hypothetical protein ACN4EK_13735 [Pantanalinema rosaneae CENA516]
MYMEVPFCTLDKQALNTGESDRLSHSGLPIVSTPSCPTING